MYDSGGRGNSHCLAKGGEVKTYTSKQKPIKGSKARRENWTLRQMDARKKVSKETRESMSKVMQAQSEKIKLIITVRT